MGTVQQKKWKYAADHCKNVKIGMDNGRLKQKRPKAILNESDIFVEKVEMNHLKAAP